LATTAPAPDLRALPPRGFVGIILVSAIANLGQSAAPLIVGGAIDVLRLSAVEAAQLISIELGGFAAGSLLCSTRIHIWNRRIVCAIGAAAVILGNGLSCFSRAYAILLLLRLMAGIGSALANSGFSATAASTKNPDRTFGLVNASSIAGSGVLIWFASIVMARWHLVGVFAMICFLAILFAPGALLIPAHPHPADQPPLGGSQSAYIDIPAKFQRIGVGLCLSMLFLVFAGQGAIWAFQERIGAASGMDATAIGFWIGIARLIFGAGASVLAGLGLALGRFWPQVISFAGAIFAVKILGLMNHIAFAVGTTLLTTAWFWGLAYQLGLLSRFDRLGRANVAGDMVTTAGLAGGPLMAGLLAGSSFGALTSVVALIFVLGFILASGAVAVYNRVERHQIIGLSLANSQE
jgi:MFS transporter, DHA1 family, inner membrane transport protein